VKVEAVVRTGADDDEAEADVQAAARGSDGSRPRVVI